MVCVNSVTVYPGSISLKVGKWYYGAYAEICPTDATCCDVTWHSSNTNVATVNAANGYIYAKAAGTAKIYATATDGSGKSGYLTVTVTAPVKVTSVSLNQSSLNLEKGEIATLTATILPGNADNKTLDWCSCDTSVATVSNGVVTTVGKGTTIITASATDDSGKSASATVTVTETVYVTSVTLNKSNLSLEKGDSTTLTATVLPSNATSTAVVWTSSNKNVATVNEGVVTAVAQGSATITATATDGSGKSDSLIVTVTEIINVTSVTLSRSGATLKKGESLAFAATVLPENATNKAVSWSSNDTAVATVSDGIVSAVGKGTAVITATATDGSGKSATATVTVTEEVKVTSITLSKTSMNLEKGTSFSLAATVLPADATNKTVTWSSSNTAVATVQNGVVTGVKCGSAAIIATATDGSGVIASCSVAVIISVTSISLERSTLSLKKGRSTNIGKTVCPENASNKQVSWSSNNPDVASVGVHNGTIFANKAGQATIKATAKDGSGVYDTCVVTVEPEIMVESITLEPNISSINLWPNMNMTFSACVCPTNADRKTVRWESSNEDVATIDRVAGLLSTHKVGKAVITVKAQDDGGATASFVLYVIPHGTRFEPNMITPKESTVADPIDAYSGAHLLQHTVMSLFGGQALNLTLHYRSDDGHQCGEFGAGWYHTYEKYLDFYEDTVYAHKGSSIVDQYIASSDCCTKFICTSADKKEYVMSVDCSQEYPYMIDCNSQHIEYYGEDGKLAKIVDHQGFETFISYEDRKTIITDAVSGKNIYLEKDECGKIVSVCDDVSRKATFTYNGNHLTAICDVNGSVLSYTYDNDGRVLTGTDANGICYFTNTYDTGGKVATQKDGVTGSTASKFEYIDDSSTQKRTVTTINRNGKKSVRVFDKNGLLIKYTDENNNEKTYTYDSCGNVIKETDANGNSVIKAYNKQNKPTEITDYNGNKTVLTYDVRGNVIKITYPAVNGVSATETFVYTCANKVSQHTDTRGIVTTYTYDANGMPATKKVGDREAVQYSYVNGLLVSQTDARGNTTRYGHNATGQVISKIDAHNNTTSYVYDKLGNLLKITDANGKTVNYTYDGNRQRLTATDANGNTTEYSYNGNMKNDIVILPDGHTVCYEFDGEDKVIKVIDRANNVTNITYDDAGRVISKKFADGANVQYEYDAVGNVVKETNPKGAVTTKTYDAVGNVLTVKDHAGNVTTYEYNAMSKVTKMTNAVAGTIVYEYSKAGDLLSETDALGNKKTYSYDAYGNKLSETDALGNKTEYEYDANNNLVKMTDALGNVTEYTYNSLNQLVSVEDAKGNVVRYGYDALSRRTTITDACGNVFTTTYDANGNVIKTTDAKGNTISETVYNCLNHPLTVIDSMGKVTTYTYNALGKVESVTDSLGHRTEFTYNSRGQNTAVRDAANNVSSATYDLLGNVTRLAGPLGGATEYTYDDMGRLVTESTVSGGTKSYEYNELNVRKKITNARGQIRQIFYDATGRITGYTSPEGTVSYTYDANGNVLTVVDSHGTITRSYDALNRVLSYTDTYGKMIRYEYDAVGNLSKIVYPDNTAVIYEYDANHNLVRVTDWANRVTSYTYDANNRLVGVTKLDGSVTTTVYDNKQRVISTVEKTACGTVIIGFEYTYDDLSRIIEEKVLANSTKMCYTYDSLNRVTARTIKNATTNAVISTETYTYDAAGNIADAPDSCFQYDTNNRLVSYCDNAVFYDMDGNMLSNGTLTCTYDSANRLISAGGHTYTYNAEDVRIRNLCSDADTTYTYDTNCKLSQLLEKTTNGITTKYVYGRGLIGEEKCGAFKTYHFDCRGSTIAITDEGGNITDTFAYDTYGKLISRTGSNFVIFGYNGRDGVVTDDSGLIYMRARYYSPEMKRFINADIVAGKLSNAVTLNRFAYANGNPVSFVDPFGLSPERVGISQADYDKFVKTLRDLFIISKKQELAKFEYTDGILIYYQNYELTLGDGPIDIDKLIAGQIEVSQSFDFLTGTFKKKTGTEILLGIEYSVDVDDYNSISASMTINYDQTMSVEYQINTNYNDGYSLATTMGIKTNKNNTPPPSTVTVPDRVTEKEEAPSFLEKTGELLEEIGDGIDAIGQGLANYSEEHPFWGALAYVAVTVVGIAVVGGVIVAPFP